MKNPCLKLFILFLFTVNLIIACDASGDNNGNGNGNGKEVTKTGRVTFFNESSYRVKVHRDAFSGPGEAELGAGQSKAVDIRISENHGFGTTFSIEYLYRINDAFDADSGEIIASGLDFNVQINRIIEENKSYTIQIPQPANLEFRTAFIKLLNAHNLPAELRDFGRILRQTGNDIFPIAPGKTGVYKLDGIPAAGEVYHGYEVVATYEQTVIPDFTVMNGFIYSFTFNGSSVTKTGEQTIVFK
jgi:hypothetical protein